MNLGPYAKALNGTVVAGIAAAVTALEDGTITPAEWTAIAAATLVAALAIFYVPNTHTGLTAYGKAITAALVAALGVLGTGLADSNLTTTELLLTASALLNGLVVSQTPNAEHSDYRITA